jgi:hypothetical protein
MNIDFSNQPGFSAYVVLLLVSGVALIILAAVPLNGATVGARVISGLVGAAMFGYGAYLGFIFTGGEYHVLFQVFLLPLLLIVNFFRSLGARRRARNAPQYAPARVPQQGQYPAQYPAAQYPAPQAPAPTGDVRQG